VAWHSDLTIRQLRPGDCQELTTLLQDAFAEEFESADAEPSAVLRQVRTAAWAQLPGVNGLLRLLGARFAYFVAVYRGRVVGSTAVGGSRLMTVSSVAVLPDFRGLGIGRALVDQAQRYAAAQGRDRVVLDVLAHNTTALSLYERMGYVEYHRYRAYELPRLPADLAARAPGGYWLEPITGRRATTFASVERASLPARYLDVVPTPRDRYIRSRAGEVLEGLAGGPRPYRRALVHEGRTSGYLLATSTPGHGEGRIEMPLVLPQAVEALPAALADAIRFLEFAGRTVVRVDVSEDRPDQQRQVEALGLRYRWTYVQMVNWLSKSIRIQLASPVAQRTRM
jgi:ribosomal protein S18 acetylase RimI-like enzyme